VPVREREFGWGVHIPAAATVRGKWGDWRSSTISTTPNSSQSVVATCFAIVSAERRNLTHGLVLHASPPHSAASTEAPLLFAIRAHLHAMHQHLGPPRHAPQHYLGVAPVAVSLRYLRRGTARDDDARTPAICRMGCGCTESVDKSLAPSR